MGSCVRFAFVCVLVLMAFMQSCHGGGVIEVKMKRYESSCSDNFFFSTECDTFFYMCIDKPGAWDINSCYYKRFGPSRHYENTNNMNFYGDVGGITNPLVATTSRFDSGQFMFVVESHDDEAIQSDEHLVTIGKTVSFTPALGKSSAIWRSEFMSSGNYRVWFHYRVYCEAYYHTQECDVYCKAQDNDNGHYTCNEQTGEKICMRGWTDPSTDCTTDINECEAGPCYNNAPCTNLPGTYECTCPNGFTGQDCNLIDSLCHSTPCQNNGTCSGDMQNYTCSCSFEWEGANCENQVDFCESNPCENNATCYGKIGNYHCACDLGWTGQNCTTQVFACDESPCQNGAICTNLPREEYTCTCQSEYEGTNCEALKNPCDPNPCENSGNCTKLNYETYNCTCVYGWDGENCSSYIVITNEQQQGQTEEKKGVNWVPIVIAFVCALVLVTLLLVLLFIRRRRRQKKELQTRLSDNTDHSVQPVAGHDNLAFRNALYDNQANSMRDRSGERAAMPVPQTPSRDELFFPTKPKQLPDEELGAVGGGPNPYQSIDGDDYLQPTKGMKGAVGGVELDKDTKQKTAVGGSLLDTRTMAGYDKDLKPPANDYADFGELQRRSIAARQNSALEQALADPDATEKKEENHYQELDDVILSIQNDSNGAVHFNPSQPTASHVYDTLPARTPAVAPAACTPGAGYMSMDRSSSQPPEPEPLDSTDDEDEGVQQEDLEKLRQEVLQNAAAASHSLA